MFKHLTLPSEKERIKGASPSFKTAIETIQEKSGIALTDKADMLHTFMMCVLDKELKSKLNDITSESSSDDNHIVFTIPNSKLSFHAEFTETRLTLYLENNHENEFSLESTQSFLTSLADIFGFNVTDGLPDLVQGFASKLSIRNFQLTFRTNAANIWQAELSYAPDNEVSRFLGLDRIDLPLTLLFLSTQTVLDAELVLHFGGSKLTGRMPRSNNPNQNWQFSFEPGEKRLNLDGLSKVMPELQLKETGLLDFVSDLGIELHQMRCEVNKSGVVSMGVSVALSDDSKLIEGTPIKKPMLTLDLQNPFTTKEPDISFEVEFLTEVPKVGDVHFSGAISHSEGRTTAQVMGLFPTMRLGDFISSETQIPGLEGHDIGNIQIKNGMVRFDTSDKSFEVSCKGLKVVLGGAKKLEIEATLETGNIRFLSDVSDYIPKLAVGYTRVPNHTALTASFSAKVLEDAMAFLGELREKILKADTFDVSVVKDARGISFILPRDLIGIPKDISLGPVDIKDLDIYVSPSTPSFRLAGQVDFDILETHVKLIAALEAGASEFAGELKVEADIPIGKHVVLKALMLALKQTRTLTSLEGGCDFSLYEKDGQFKMGIDPIKKIPSFFHFVYPDVLSIPRVLAAFTDKVTLPEELNQILNQFKLTPTEPDQKPIEIKYDPSNMEFLINCAFQFTDMLSGSIHAELSLSQGMLIDTKLDPVNVGEALKITASSLEQSQAAEPDKLGPKLYVFFPGRDNAARIKEACFKLDGCVELFGAKNQVSINISNEGIMLFLEQKLWDAYEAKLYVKGTVSEAQMQLHVDAVMKIQMLEKLLETLGNAVTSFTEEGVKALEHAREGVKKAQQFLTDTNAAIQHEIDWLNHCLDEDRRYRASLSSWNLVEHAVMETKIRAREASVEVFRWAQEGNNFLKGIPGVGAAVFEAKKQALYSLQGVEQTLRELENVTTMAGKTAKYLIDESLGSLCSVRKLAFNCDLNSHTGGIVDLEIYYVYMGYRKLIELKFDFQKPEESLITMSKELVAKIMDTFTESHDPTHPEVLEDHPPFVAEANPSYGSLPGFEHVLHQAKTEGIIEMAGDAAIDAVLDTCDEYCPPALRDEIKIVRDDKDRLKKLLTQGKFQELAEEPTLIMAKAIYNRKIQEEFLRQHKPGYEVPRDDDAEWDHMLKESESREKKMPMADVSPIAGGLFGAAAGDVFGKLAGTNMAKEVIGQVTPQIKDEANRRRIEARKLAEEWIKNGPPKDEKMSWC